jgi:Fe-S-cluster containining protein
VNEPPTETEPERTIAVDVHRRMVDIEDEQSQLAERMRRRADRIGERAPLADRQRLIDRALASKKVSQRILWLRREADQVVEAARDDSTCQSGCAHCCHISVLVAEPEAIEIGRAIGRSPANPGPNEALQYDTNNEAAGAAHIAELQRRNHGVACTFLDQGQCAIYRHRPLACRYLISLDDDELLCSIVPGEHIKAPYIDTAQQSMAYVVAMKPSVRYADIRAWFPAEAEPG